MTVSDWVTVTAALVGAVVGGIMALMGAILVARREQLRATRMRLLEVIDALREHNREYPGQFIPEDLRELHRSQLLLSRRERRVLRTILQLAATPPPALPRKGTDPEQNPSLLRHRQAVKQLDDQLDAVERLVLRRLARMF